MNRRAAPHIAAAPVVPPDVYILSDSTGSLASAPSTA